MLRNTEGRKGLYAGILDKPDMQRVIDQYIKNIIIKHSIKTYSELIEYMQANFEPAYFRVVELGEKHYQTLIRQNRIVGRVPNG